MKRFVIAAALVAGLVGAEQRADAFGKPARPHPHTGPFATSVTWPSVSPPGWYTNTYNHRWYYPWYAYYDYTTGPYANWAAGGGYATYGNHGPAGFYYYPQHQPAPAPAAPKAEAPKTDPPKK